MSWHKRLGHLKFLALKRYLYQLKVDFLDDSKDYIYNNCQKAIATKVYN